MPSVGAALPPEPTRTPAPATYVPSPSTAPDLPPSTRMYGVLSADNRYLKSDWEAGIRLRELELSWWRHEPQNNVWDSTYVTWKREEIDAARKAGYKIVLDLGLQYPPEWARKIRPMKDQFGNSYDNHVERRSRAPKYETR